ncbi:hypothetical protein ABZ783_24565 [Micromonospora sp. NPDC047738]|uniref:hypothetical protein n=1 Tax=Micromonospora sp. NPDC047738 TaxID=3155741 RepID=UPI0033DB5FE0
MDPIGRVRTFGGSDQLLKTTPSRRQKRLPCGHVALIGLADINSQRRLVHGRRPHCHDDDVIIPGYLDRYEPPFLRSPLVDGSSMMSHALFWPAFLSTVGGSASAPDAFNVDPADLEQIVDTLLDPRSWPVFSLPLLGHRRLHAIMGNFEDDGGVDYVLNTLRFGQLPQAHHLRHALTRFTAAGPATDRRLPRTVVRA